MNLTELSTRIGNIILDILFPRFCLGCGREGVYICKDCEVFLSEAPNTIPGLTTIWQYEGIMEKIIQAIKYQGHYHLIDELVERAFEKISLELPQDTYITYVPMYRKREKQRGFNQAELIAKGVAEKTGRPVVKLLEKTKDNRSQVGLNPKERLENVKGVFEYRESPIFSERFTPEGPYASQKIQGSRSPAVLLVDDVYTTGATMRECIKILKKGGIKNVWGFTLSRKMNIQNY